MRTLILFATLVLALASGAAYAQSDSNAAAVSFEVSTGNDLLAAGDAAQAVEHFKQALAYDPDTVTALQPLAWIYATDSSLRDPKQAVQYGERLIELTYMRQRGGAWAKAYRIQNTYTLAAAYAVAGNVVRARELGNSAVGAAMQYNQAAAIPESALLLQQTQNVFDTYVAPLLAHARKQLESTHSHVMGDYCDSSDDGCVAQAMA